MRVLLLGSGGREHALGWKLRQSPRRPDLWALPGSHALRELEGARCIPGDPCDPATVLGACREHRIDLAVIGPEAPLAAGVADVLRSSGLRVFGPGRAAARLESSKAFAKDFMARHGIPTARHETFTDPAAAQETAARSALPLAVKADGLAAGKGVWICRTRRQAAAAIQALMVERRLGEAGARVVLEECLSGPEITIMALCDGSRCVPLAASRDHKRLKDGDAGPNTGGMGAVAPVDLDPGTAAEISDLVLARTLRALQAEGLEFRGLLYCGLMLTAGGPKVLEFNVRFGDPETQAVLPLLNVDLLDLLEATAAGSLGNARIAWRDSHSLCLVLASEGYPLEARIGRKISGLALPGPADGIHMFHAGTTLAGGDWLTSGGRVLNVCAVAPSPDEARSKAYGAASRLGFQGMRYRRDIGSRVAA